MSTGITLLTSLLFGKFYRAIRSQIVDRLRTQTVYPLNQAYRSVRLTALSGYIPSPKGDRRQVLPSTR